MTKVTINLDDRRFIVFFDDHGEPLRIKERKRIHPDHPYLTSVYDYPYWHAKHHKLGGPTTLPVRILAAARELMANA